MKFQPPDLDFTEILQVYLWGIPFCAPSKPRVVVFPCGTYTGGGLVRAPHLGDSLLPRVSLVFPCVCVLDQALSHGRPIDVGYTGYNSEWELAARKALLGPTKRMATITKKKQGARASCRKTT